MNILLPACLPQLCHSILWGFFCLLGELFDRDFRPQPPPPSCMPHMARGTFFNMIQAGRVGTLAQDGRHDLLVHAGCAANRQLRSASAPWLQRVAVPQQHGMYRRAFGTSGPTSPPTKHEADPRSVPKRSEASAPRALRIYISGMPGELLNKERFEVACDASLRV